MSRSKNIHQIAYLALLLVGLGVMLAACAVVPNPLENEIIPDSDSLEEAISEGKEIIATVYPYPVPGQILDKKIKLRPGQLPGMLVILDVREIVPNDETPSGYALRLVGTKPTPCHDLEIEVLPPDEDGKIEVTVFTVSEPGEICIQVIDEFDIIEPLDVYNPDTNTVWVNGEEVEGIR